MGLVYTRKVPEILPYLVNALLYGALAFYFWRTRWSAGGAARRRRGARFSVVEHYAVLVPLALHAALLARAVFAPDGLHLGVGNAVSAILWLTVLIYWLGNFFYRLDGLQSLVLPVAAVAALLPAVLPSLKPLPNTELVAFKIHLLIAMARLQPVHHRVAARAADGAARAPPARRRAAAARCATCRRC